MYFKAKKSSVACVVSLKISESLVFGVKMVHSSLTNT